MFVVYIPNPPSMITDTTKHNKTSKSTYVSKEHGVVICVIIYNSLIIIVIYIYIHLYVCITRLYAYNHISIVYNAPIGSRPTMVSSGCLSGTSSTSAACAVATGGWWSWRSYWRFQWPKMGNPGTKWLLKWENHIIYRYRIDISHTMYIHIYIYIFVFMIYHIYIDIIYHSIYILNGGCSFLLDYRKVYTVMFVNFGRLSDQFRNCLMVVVRGNVFLMDKSVWNGLDMVKAISSSRCKNPCSNVMCAESPRLLIWRYSENMYRSPHGFLWILQS